MQKVLFMLAKSPSIECNKSWHRKNFSFNEFITIFITMLHVFLLGTCQELFILCQDFSAPCMFCYWSNFLQQLRNSSPEQKPIIAKGLKGTVAWYSVRDCYGFIKRDHGEKDVFEFFFKFLSKNKGTQVGKSENFKHSNFCLRFFGNWTTL